MFTSLHRAMHAMQSVSIPSINVGGPGQGPGPGGDAKTTVSGFIAKLWQMVEDSAFDHLIMWDMTGDSFHILDEGVLAKEVLPQFYKHNNISSFVRQLNFYGFQKKPNMGALKQEIGDAEFFHPCFIRGAPELLPQIKRKATKLEMPPRGGFAPDGSLKALVPAEEVTKVLDDVHALKGQQESMDAKLSSMKRENEALWREVSTLRNKHSQQQQVVQRLVHFLLTVVGRSGSRKRRMPLAIESGAPNSPPDGTGLSVPDDGPSRSKYSRPSPTPPTSAPPPIVQYSVVSTLADQRQQQVQQGGPVIQDVTGLASPPRPDPRRASPQPHLRASPQHMPQHAQPPQRVPERASSVAQLDSLSRLTSPQHSQMSPPQMPMTSMSQDATDESIHNAIMNMPPSHAGRYKRTLEELSEHVGQVQTGLHTVKDVLGSSMDLGSMSDSGPLPTLSDKVISQALRNRVDGTRGSELPPGLGGPWLEKLFDPQSPLPNPDDFNWIPPVEHGLPPPHVSEADIKGTIRGHELIPQDEEHVFDIMDFLNVQTPTLPPDDKQPHYPLPTAVLHPGPSRMRGPPPMTAHHLPAPGFDYGID